VIASGARPGGIPSKTLGEGFLVQEIAKALVPNDAVAPTYVEHTVGRVLGEQATVAPMCSMTIPCRVMPADLSDESLKKHVSLRVGSLGSASHRLIQGTVVEAVQFPDVTMRCDSP